MTGFNNKTDSNYVIHFNSNNRILILATKLYTSVNLPNKITIKALIDTGADVSCILKHLTEDLDLSNEMPEKVSAFNGDIISGRWTRPIRMQVFGHQVTKKF